MRTAALAICLVAGVALCAASAAPAATDRQPEFPIRAAFYYPWFTGFWPAARQTEYHPSLGFYGSDDLGVIRRHIRAMRYGRIEAGIVSWWGRSTFTDRVFSKLLRAAAGTPFRWAVYYEREGYTNPSVGQIRADLTYLERRYGSTPAYLRVRGRFVVFVWADGGDDCGMADRWTQANSVHAYIVLKVFPESGGCSNQPDDWHEYAPMMPESNEAPSSFTISPGLWNGSESSPRLPRDLARWRRSIHDLVDSRARFQLITTFNEWGEGTAIESADEWQSPSGYGAYLDALHAVPTTPMRAPSGTTPAGGRRTARH